MMLRLITTRLVPYMLVGISAASNVLDPWGYLPPKQDWPLIIKSLEDVDQVKSYVRIYTQPFRELQTAERSASISPDVVKASTVAMLELSHTACRMFNISEATFEKHSKDSFRQALEDATGVFEGPNAQHLEPIYKIRSVRNFVFQRLDDMLVAAKKYKDFMQAKQSYEKHLEYAHRIMKNWESSRYKYIVPRNLDLDLVRKYSVEAISARLDKKLEAEDVDSLRWQLSSLGNGASKLAIPWLLMVLPLAAITMLV